MGYSVRLQGVKPLKVQKRSGSRAARRVALVYGAQIGTYRPADAGIVRQRLLNNLSHQHRGHGGAGPVVGQGVGNRRLQRVVVYGAGVEEAGAPTAAP